MKRWVWLGLVGLLACNDNETDKPVEPQDCTDTSESALPPEGLSSMAQELSPEESRAALEGRQSVLIQYRRTLSAASATRSAEDAVERTGGRVTARWSRLGAVAAQVTPEERERLADDPNVLSIEPDRPVRAFSRQPLVTTGSVGEYTEGLKLVQATEVWDANNDGVLDANAPTGANIKVCVIDSGWDNRHPELAAAYVGGKDFIDDDDDPLDQDKVTGKWGGGHGTHTAATIVAQLSSAGIVDPSDDKNGVVGVAPGVDLLVARVLNTRGNGSTSDIISALEWCQGQGAKIASLSLGAAEPSTAEKDAFASALAAGMLPIAASGNGGTGEPDTEPGVAYPAAYPSVIAVGAVNFKSEHPAFSQVGPEVSLVAPGVNVLSAVVLGSESFSIVEADGITYASRSLAFAPVGNYTGKLLTCGLGDSSSACGKEATCEGFVAYVDRGGKDSDGNGLTFAKKVGFMRKAGARAVIIGNNDPTDGVGSFTLGDEGTWVPTASVSQKDGALLKYLAGKEAAVKLVGVDYVRLTGTSMAAPHVAGVAALLWSARPSLSPGQVRALLEESAKDLGTKGRDNLHGHGLVQAKAAMTLLESRYPPTTP
jgi:subtilisin family serine protease